MRRNMLISPERVNINEYFHTWGVKGFRLAGFISVTPYTAPPAYDSWSDTAYNRFCGIASEAEVDGKPTFVLPVFVNDERVDYVFDGDTGPSANAQLPAIAFFKGNDDWHFALRFDSYSERDAMVEFFGEDLGFLEDHLIGHN